MENKLSFQKNLYKVFFASTMAIALCGVLLSCFLYLNCYDPEVGMFSTGLPFTVYCGLGAFAIVCCIALCFAPVFTFASPQLAKPGSISILANSFCGFFVAAYVILSILDAKEQGAIPYVLLIMALCAVIGSLYFHYQTVSSSPNKTTLAILGLFMVIFTIINIYAVHYTAKDVLLNSPQRILSLVSMSSIMMFLINEIRYHLGISNPRGYFAFGMITVFFSLSNSLPRIILSVTNTNGFETGSMTLLLCFEFFMAVYAIIRLAGYLKDGMFTEMQIGKAEEDEKDNEEFSSEEEDLPDDDDDDVIIYNGSSKPEEPPHDSHQENDEEDKESDLTDNETLTDTCENEQETPDSEHISEENAEEEEVINDADADANENQDMVEEKSETTADGNSDGQEQFDNSSMMSFSDDITDDNDLPDDNGFEGGNEGDFEVEGFAMVEEIPTEVDDDDGDDSDDADAHPFVVHYIDEDEFDNIASDEGQIIDYEDPKSTSGSENNEETSDEEDLDDGDIDMDVDALISGEEIETEEIDSENPEIKTQPAPAETEVAEKKSYKQKFKFVKKM